MQQDVVEVLETNGKSKKCNPVEARLYNIFTYLFIYLSLSGLSCDTRDRHCIPQSLWLRCTDSLVAARRLVALRPVGSQFPDQASNLTPALQGGFLNPGCSGKSQSLCKFKAQKLDFGILGGSILSKKLPEKPPTIPIGFDFETEKRIKQWEAKKT